MRLHGKSKQWAWGGSPKFSQESLILQKLAFHNCLLQTKDTSHHTITVHQLLRPSSCRPLSYIFPSVIPFDLTFFSLSVERTLLWGSYEYCHLTGKKVEARVCVCVCVCVCSVMSNSLPSHGLASQQAPLCREFSRQEHWSGLLFPTSGDLPDPGIEPVSLASPPLAFSTTVPLGKPQVEAHRGSATHLRSKPLDGAIWGCLYPTIFDLETDSSIRFKLIAIGRTRIHSTWLILEQILWKAAQTLLGDLSVLASIILPCEYLFSCLFPFLSCELSENRNYPSLASETPDYLLSCPTAWS